MEFLLNLLFPKFCIGCNKIGTYICPRCFLKFEFLQKQQCPYCFMPNEKGMTHTACRRNDGLDGAYSLLTYTGITRVFIKDIKYRRMYSVIEDFFRMVPETVNNAIIHTMSEYNIHAIQSIPLHPERKRLRGFNQSDEIAKYISKTTNIPIVTIISRTVNTSPQAQIQRREERERNIHGAFIYDGDTTFSGKNILLIDDLFTSGSTSKEATKILKQHSIRGVYVFTLAHG